MWQIKLRNFDFSEFLLHDFSNLKLHYSVKIRKSKPWYWEIIYNQSHENHLVVFKVQISRAVIGWKRVLYQSTKHRSELKLSRHLPNCSMSDLSPGHLSSFFSFWFFSASRKLAREEPNKGLWKCQTPKLTFL